MAISHKADIGYTLAGIALAVAGWIAGLVLFGDGGDFNAKEGVSVFALVYVLAQGVERVVEVTLAFVGGLAGLFRKELATTTKAKAVFAITAAASAPAVAPEKAKAESAEADTRALAFGLALGVAFLGCGYFGVKLLDLIGVNELNDLVELFVTGFVVAGGSKPLHDLISKIQKSKQKDEKAVAA